MTKAKSMTPKSQASTPKGDLKGVKNTSIGKNKTPKFKKTPTGKVALINGTPKGKGNQNTENNTPKVKGNLNTENNTPKGKVNTPLNTPKHKGNSKPNTPNNKQATPGNKKKSPAVKSPLVPKLSETELKAAQITEDDDDDSDNSDEDINEGVEINEVVSDEEADSDSEGDEGSDEDVGINNILGHSLAEDSDEDDSDFDENGDEEEGEEEADEEEVVNKGVKQFKGLKPNVEQSDDGEEEEEEDSDSEDDEDDSLNDSGPGLKALLGQSLADDDDDEDFTDNDEEEDDDDDISDDEEDEDHTSPIKKQKIVAEEDNDEDEEEDSDDDDEENEDSDDAEDDTETSKLSVLETDDDEEDDDEDDDDEDLTDGKSLDDSVKGLTPQEVEARDRRSIYVGNLPKDVVRDQLVKLFKKFGTIEVIRIRGGVGKDGKTSKKLSIIKRDQLHPVVSSLHAYIRYHAEDAAKKALSMNGHNFNEFFLRVDLVSGDGPKPDPKKAVFLGNLPFKIDDNSLWSHFADCGKIVSVRIVRDKKTQIGKGFGYINFENSDSVALALELNGTTLLNRVIRVNACTDKPSSQKKQGQLNQKRPHSKPNQGSSPKRRKENSGDPIAVATHNSQNAQQRKEAKQQKRSQGEQQRQKGNEQSGSKSGGGFQGQKADKKKKQKFNKFDKKKKQIAAKFAAKPK